MHLKVPSHIPQALPDKRIHYQQVLELMSSSKSLESKSIGAERFFRSCLDSIG